MQTNEQKTYIWDPGQFEEERRLIESLEAEILEAEMFVPKEDDATDGSGESQPSESQHKSPDDAFSPFLSAIRVLSHPGSLETSTRAACFGRSMRSANGRLATNRV
jgi:hypothetical protein